MSHPQVAVRHPSGERVQVDERLAVSLIALWKLGIATDYSCQGDDDCRAYLSFADLASADRFAELVHRRTWTWEIAKRSPRQRLRALVRFPPRDVRFLERALIEALAVRRRAA